MSRWADADLGPTAGAGLGDDGLIGAVEGHHFEGGQGKVGCPPAEHEALVQAGALKGHGGPEEDAGLEAIRKDVAAVVPALVHPAKSPCGRVLQQQWPCSPAGVRMPPVLCWMLHAYRDIAAAPSRRFKERICTVLLTATQASTILKEGKPAPPRNALCVAGACFIPDLLT